MRVMTSPPTSLVTNGKFNLGTFNAPIDNLNMLDGKIMGLPLPRAARYMRLKEWQAVQIGCQRYFIILALFNAKMLALAQIKIYDRKTGQKTVVEKKLTPWSFRCADSLMDSTVAYEGGGLSIRFDNRLREGTLAVAFSYRGDRDSLPIKGQITTTGDTDHQVAILPLPKKRALYAHKGQFPAEGTIQVGDEEVKVGSPDGYLLLDDHRGFYPYVMKWDWVTGGGVNEEGQLIGFNLTRNQALEPHRYNENALWIAGNLHLLPPVRFERIEEKERTRWFVRDEGDHVRLNFDVSCPGNVRINLGVIESRYQGPFGSFSGHLEGFSGPKTCINHCFGMGERFYLRC
jgi:hypothetical protein